MRHLLKVLALWACTVSPAAWASGEAGTWNRFMEVGPTDQDRSGGRAGDRTSMTLRVEDGELRVAVRASDPDPAGIVARQMRRDAYGILSDDHFALVVDPSGTGRNGFLFVVNANGAQFDALIVDGGSLREDWDARWQVQAGRDGDGWHADMRIPLSVLGRRGARQGEVPGVWRINAERWVARTTERTRLAGAAADKEVYSLGDALEIPAPPGAQDRPAHGSGLRWKPALRVSHDSASVSETGRARTRLEPELELFHESETGLRTAAALNLDFGDAEADDRSINLTRFELFRPERREFFQRDAGRFTFGGLTDSAVSPFYSRSIGVDAEGRAHTLDAGLKLVGQVGDFDVGLLGARTPAGEVGARHSAVLRVARPMGEHHRTGLIATADQWPGQGHRRLWGVDQQFRDTNWAPPWGGAAGKTLESHLWYLRSSQGDAGQDSAWGTSLRYPNFGLTGDAEFQRIGERFSPALGYLAEAGVTRGLGSVGWWHRDERGLDVIPGLDWEFRRKFDGRERSWQLNPEIAFTNPEGDTAMLEIFHETDRTAAPFELLPGLTIPAGDHRWRYVFGLLETSNAREVSAAATFRNGGFYGGHRRDLSLQLNWQPSPVWGWQIGLERNALRLPAGRFTVRTASLRTDFTPSTRLAGSVLLQWDNVSQSLGASARLKWQWGPNTDLLIAIDRLGYTGALRRQQASQQAALLKLVWNLER